VAAAETPSAQATMSCTLVSGSRRLSRAAARTTYTTVAPIKRSTAHASFVGRARRGGSRIVTPIRSAVAIPASPKPLLRRVIGRFTR
jgi:hypothetical protein